MSEENIRGNHNPGAGGWPTIRFFNKDTGYDGRGYTQKTSQAICDELGNEENMKAYVMEAASISTCKLDDRKECSEREINFMELWKSKSNDEINNQLTRLKALKTSKMKPELVSWVNQRVAILKQMSASTEKEEL